MRGRVTVWVLSLSCSSAEDPPDLADERRLPPSATTERSRLVEEGRP